MATPAFGSQAKLAFDDASPIDGSSYPLEFISCNLRKVETILDASEAGIRGTRSRVVERTRQGHYDVIGTVVLNPSPSDLNQLLKNIMGSGTPSGVDPDQTTNATLAETIPAFVMGMDHGGSGVDEPAWEFTGLKVNRAIFRAAAQGLLELELDLIGQTAVDIDAGYPSLTLGTDVQDRPYIFSDTVFTLAGGAGGARPIKSFEVTIDNFVVPQFTNSQTATNVNATDRQVSLTIVTPYDTVTDDILGTDAVSGLFDTSRASSTLVLTHGSDTDMSLTFTFAELQAGQETPSVNDKGEVELTFPMIARRSGATLELTIDNDANATA